MANKRQHILVMCFISMFNYACFADELKTAEASHTSNDGLGIGGIPALTFDPDSGLGFGVVGNLYFLREGVKPYLWSLDAQGLASTKGAHSHFLRLDAIDVFGFPIRLRARVGFYATLNTSYCGKGTNANCDEEVVEQRATELQIPNEQREAFLSHYLLRRYLEAYGILETRFKLQDWPHKREIVLTYRGNRYWSGTFGDLTPYADSKFVEDFAPQIQQGFNSQLEAGIIFDGRDHEPQPTTGYFIETTIRESSPLFGADFSYFGMHLAGRIYVPFDASRKWILATHLLLDAMFGEAPLQEIARVGGSLGSISWTTAFGGSEIGRGLREQYFLGRMKFIKQLELRYTFIGFDIFRQHFDTTAAAFLDTALIAWDLNALMNNPFRPVVGFGAGIRLLWNRIFVIRIDVAFSPIEHYAPKVYVKIGNVF